MDHICDLGHKAAELRAQRRNFISSGMIENCKPEIAIRGYDFATRVLAGFVRETL